MPSHLPGSLSIRPVRRLLTGIVLIATLVAANHANASPTGAAAAAWKTCPYIWKDLTNVTARHVSCRTAEKVARAYMAFATRQMVPRPHRVLGFHCKVVWVGHPRSNWYANCTKGKAVVRAVPE